MYKFGINRQKSLGSIVIRIPTPDTSMMIIKTDVVNADVPFLLGLDNLDKFGLYLDTVKNKLVCPRLDWSMELIRKLGHVYLEWKSSDTILFTRSELTKLHRNFYHPGVDKLMQLIKQARPSEFNEETRKSLQEISDACDTCQRFGPRPLRFKATIPDENKLVFGQELSIDLMWIDGKALLHVVDTATRFSNATFLDSSDQNYGQSVEGIWLAFLECWCSMYTGYPDRLRTDAGSVFTSPRWKEIAKMAGIELRLSGIEAHNSLGIGERYHEPLRRIYRKVKHDHPNLMPKTILRLSLKAMNDTMGENGLVPSLLTFGVIPRFPILNTELPTQQERLEALKKAQAEMNSIVAERRIKRALLHKVPNASNYVFRPGTEVLVYREDEKKWKGPLTVKAVNEKIATLRNDDNGAEADFNVQQLKPYFRPIPFLDKVPNKNSSYAMNYMLEDLATTKKPQSPDYGVHLTEVILPGDPRSKDPRFAAAKEKEIRGLIERGTWKLVAKDEVPNNANIMGGRFVLAIKDEGTQKEVWKARFIVQGYRDKLKTSLVHDSASSRQFSTRLLVGLAAIFGFRLFSTDVTRAYLQSAEELMRDVYIKPNGEFELGPDQLLKLLKPLYGLCDSGDYWGKTFSQHLTDDLGMKPTTLDPALYAKKMHEKLKGLCATCVDDTLQAGDKEYQEMTKMTLEKFKCRERGFDNVQFSGVEIDSYPDEFRVHQTRYAKKMKKLSKDVTFKEYQKLRAQLAWLTHTRPDISCAVALAAQVTEKMFKEDAQKKIKSLNNILSHLNTNHDLPLRFPKLDTDSLRLQVYSDASFATNADGSSQLGYIIFLVDGSGKCQPISWSSHKAKRVTRSVLGSEVLALADAFDMAYALKHDIQALLSKEIPLVLITDSLSLFDVISKSTITAEKRLMIDLKATKESYKNREIEIIGFIRTKSNPADCLTKVTNSEVLRNILKSAKIEHSVDQWVERN